MRSDSGHPDLEALYLEHADAMHRVAARVLREAGLAHMAGDAVQNAVLSLLKSWPPEAVNSWEAFMVTAAKRKAIDILRSAAVRHADPTPVDEHDKPDTQDVAAQVAHNVDRDRMVKVLRDKLSLLPDRERFVLEEFKARGRPRAEVAREVGVTPGRVSQIAKKALTTMKQMLDEEGVTW